MAKGPSVHDQAMAAVKARAEALQPGAELDAMCHAIIMRADGPAPAYSTDDGVAMRLAAPLSALVYGRGLDVHMMWRPTVDDHWGVPYTRVSISHPGPYWHHAADSTAPTFALAMCRAALLAVWQQQECRYDEHHKGHWLMDGKAESCRHRHEARSGDAPALSGSRG